MAIETRLAEFINLLIEETLVSIQTSYSEQADRLLQLAELREQDPEGLANLLSREEVYEAIDSGSVPTKDEKEARLFLADRQLQAIKLILDQGFPKLTISEGRVNASAEFNLGQKEAVKENENRAKRSTQRRDLKKQPNQQLAGVSKLELSKAVLARVPLVQNNQLAINITPNKGASETSAAKVDIEFAFKVIYD